MSGTPQQQAMPPMREGDIYIVGPDGRMTLLDPMAAMAASSQASSQAAALQQRPTIMYIAAPPGMPPKAEK
ncbi:hypothetical protein EON68_03080 [archaeon]|nr:MAG: hypothetical protein EON68_03080 [archaeon]